MVLSAALAAALAASGAPGEGALAPGGDGAPEVPPVTGVQVLTPAPDRSPAAAREARWAAELAALYGSSAELVLSLRALGLDHVETECAVAVSTRAARPVTEVLELRRAGMEWADIARSYGFGLLEAIRQAPPARRRSERPGRVRSRP